MKRTQKKLKSKGIKAHVPNSAHAYSCCRYDRNYVAHNHSDVKQLSFTRTSWRGWMRGYEHPNGKLNKYLTYFLNKQVGNKLDIVFHKFSKLGWKSTGEMYDYWHWYVEMELDDGGDFVLSDDGVLLKNNEKDTTPEEYERTEKTPPIHPNRLTREQLEYNEKVHVNFVGNNVHYKESEVYPDLMGKFYVEYEHKVLFCPVYHIVHPKEPPYIHEVRREWRDDGLPGRYAPVKILGKYRKELTFEQHRWVSKKYHYWWLVPTGDAEEDTLIDIGCGPLLPRIDTYEV